MVIRELLEETSSRLGSVENHIFEAHLILRTVLKLSPIDLVLSHKKEVGEADICRVREMVLRRLNGEPLQYILGSQEFMGLEFCVNKNVLIPRADTETLVEAVLSHLGKNGAAVLDIGCGSGCIGLSAAHFNPRIYLRGIDISEDALFVARKNARSLGLSERAVFDKADILTEQLSGRYDVVVSNPPYIRTDEIGSLMREVRDFEPRCALDGGEDGLVFYRRIAEAAPRLLNENGLLAFEVGYDQAHEVAALMRQTFTDIKIIKDLCGVERVVTGIKAPTGKAYDADRIRFDFGCEAEHDGHIKIRPDTIYDGCRGYGIDHEADSWGSFKPGRCQEGSTVLRDWLGLCKNSFTAELENGTYMVRIHACTDTDEEKSAEYTINRVRGCIPFTCGVGSAVHEIEVTGGKMQIEFQSGTQFCLNSVEISPKRQLDAPNVLPYVTAERYRQETALAWNRIDGAQDYAVHRFNCKNNGWDRHTVTADTFFTDNSVELCGEYIYRIVPRYGCDFEAGGTNLRICVTDGGKIPSGVGELTVNETESSVALSWRGIPEAVFYNVYRRASRGSLILLASTEDTSFTDSDADTVVSFTYAVEAVTLSGKTEMSFKTSKILHAPFRRKVQMPGRTPAAIKTPEGIFLNWRINGYEYNSGLSFVVSRNGRLITKEPLTGASGYLDSNGNEGDIYTVRAVCGTKAELSGASVAASGTPYITVPLDKPAPFAAPDGKLYEYCASAAAAGDLDGDGECEIVVKWTADGTGIGFIDAYRLNGGRMWRIELGVNVCAQYTPLLVYDFNNDGKAEIILKTADGTADGFGKIIGDRFADYRGRNGSVAEGPEFLTLFDGETGSILDTVNYDPPRGSIIEGGGNADKISACTAYLDGENPSAVMCRGSGGGSPFVIAAYDVTGSRLVRQWRFAANQKQNAQYTRTAFHAICAEDTDGDGKDEIICGSMAVGHDGRGIGTVGAIFVQDTDSKNDAFLLRTDILGDWREETVLRNKDSAELHIYTAAESDSRSFSAQSPTHGYKYGDFVLSLNDLE